MRRAAALLTMLLLTAGCGQLGATPTTQATGGASSPAASLPATSPEASQPAAGSPDASGAPASPAGSAAGSPGGSAGAAVEVVGVDYAFENVPATTPAGTAFTFRNDGAELHEMVIVRRNEGVTLSFQELLALPEEEASKQITILQPHVLAAPGEAVATEVVVDEPGQHLMICFIPVGMTSASVDPSSPPMGAPHFTRGMLEEFTVE